MSIKNLPLAARLYMLLLVIAAVGAIFCCFNAGWYRPFDIALLIYMFLVVGTARMSVKFPYTDIHFSLDSPFIFVILILYGVLPALLADALAKMIMTAAHVDRKSLYKIPFNVSSGILAIFSGYIMFEALKIGPMTSSVSYMLPILGMVVGYFFVNSITVAVIICIIQKQNLASFWYKNFLPSGLGFIASGSIAVLLFILDSASSYLGFFVTVPLIGLIYFSQKIYLQKETDAQEHIQALEKVHLSTIQSLSLALDAKDEYTHGHVHRVAHYAVGLAKHLGMTDKKLLQTIAFAGLVHDIGKIAIPDAILNKPGKYTDAEFNRMKIHPVISAEILKDIPLPFPVARIVRHHHEKWDGRGYPDGLAGTEIPYESRLLAVADVYDAIRSDRPYRPKMKKERAVSIMASEKGKTLDADMVDVFLEHLDELENLVELEEEQISMNNNIQEIVKAAYLAFPSEESEEEYRRREERMRREAELFNSLASIFSNENKFGEKIQELVTAITKVLPHTVQVIYLPNEDKKALRPAFINGKDPELLHDNEMELGSGVSGWVYANASPMISNPPRTEFPAFKDKTVPYRSILSGPLGNEKHMVGVISLYSENKKAFDDDDREMLKKIGTMVGPLLKNLLEDEGES